MESIEKVVNFVEGNLKMCKFCNFQHNKNVILRTDIVQSSPEWHEVRSYSAGGTAAYDILKNGFDPRTLKKSVYGGYCSPAMQRGHDLEPEARELFSLLKKEDYEVVEAGAILNKKWAHCHASPDGLLIKDGAVVGALEIKCFLKDHHVSILEGGIEPKIKAQLLWNQWLSETNIGYFIAYNPDMEDIKDRLYVERVDLDERYKKLFEAKVSEGLKLLEEL